MLIESLKDIVPAGAAPFAAVFLFVFVVGLSLWITPRLAKWIDKRRSESRGFYDDILEQPPQDSEKE